MYRDSLNEKACIVVVFLLVASLFVGLPIVSASDDATPKPMADWTISGTETINGYIHYQRGNVIIPVGTTLNIIDGGLVFQQDTGDDRILGTADDHVYSLSVQGTLNLVDSILSTQLNLLYDYPKLDLTVSGASATLSATDSVIKFPGMFYVTNNANVILEGTTITGFTNSEIDSYVGDANGGINLAAEDDSNDGPIMLFSNSNIELYDSSIDKVYENAITPNPNAPLPDYRFDITLTGNTRMTIVNSYISIDFGYSPSTHNTILANDTSEVYTYNITVDESENPSPAFKRPALVPWGPVTYSSFSANVTAFSPAHNATPGAGSESNLWTDDSLYITVAPTRLLFADSFTIPGWQFISALLKVIYYTDMGYNGTRAVRWALDGTGLQDTTIIPVATPIEVQDTFDLFGVGVDTLPELQTLDIGFYNDATNGTNVYFDLIQVEVDYIFVDSQAEFYLHRWLDLTVTDDYNVPANGADVSSYLLPGGTVPAYYPDNGGGTVPNTKILNYLGKTAATYDVTDSAGHALIPLLTEWCDRPGGLGTMPNCEFIGNYRIMVSYVNATEPPPNTYNAEKNISFNSYPAIMAEDNTFELTIKIPGVQIPRPDLSQNDCEFVPATVYEGDIVSISANVTNIGDSPALNVLVSFSEGPTTLDNRTIPFIANGGSALTTPITWNGTTVGAHVIMVKVDPFNTVSEKDETNNNKGCLIIVNPNRPNLYIDSNNISFSANPVPNNLVYISATISNTGRANATNVLSYFYVDENVNGFAEGTPDNSSVIEIVKFGGFNDTIVGWIPPINKTYEVCVKVDPLNAIQEDDETDNFACNVLVVNPAPNLYIAPLDKDIIFSDPFPKQGDTVDISATISNIGYADSTTTFYVEFNVDGSPIGVVTVNGLAAGMSTTIPAVPISWTATNYGLHTVSVEVDYTDAEFNETNENDNVGFRDIFVYRHPETWVVTTTQTYYVDFKTDKNIEVRGTGVLTFVDSTLEIDQNDTSMHVVKVMENGRFVLQNSTITSDYPLVIYVTDNGVFESHSELLLSTFHGEGLIYIDGNSVLILEDTIVDASIHAVGQYVEIYGSDLRGSSLYIDTQTTSYIWDTTFTSVTTLELETDDSNPLTVDFDLGNLTFNQQLTDQLRFDGDQYIKFTNVTTHEIFGVDWYDGMISENAVIYRYWWLKVRSIDGTTNLIKNPDISNVVVQRYEFIGSAFIPVTQFSGNTPTGELLWAALSEVRKSIPDPHAVENTYWIQGNASLALNPGFVYDPDSQVNVTVDQNVIVNLVYSQLIPDLTVVQTLGFCGGNCNNKQEPINIKIIITAVIQNQGLVPAYNVRVDFYTFSLRALVDSNYDGFISADEAGTVNSFDHTYVNVSAPGSASAVITYVQSTASTGQPTISVFVDVDKKIIESEELNNEAEDSFNEIFYWPDYYVLDIDVPTPINNTDTEIVASIKNTGLGNGLGQGATVIFYDGGTSIGLPVDVGDLPTGSSVEVSIPWTPTQAGTHNFGANVVYSGASIYLKDYNTANNWLNKSIYILRQPDVWVVDIATPVSDVFENATFILIVNVTNTGEAIAGNFNLSVYYDQVNESFKIGTYENITLMGGDMFTALINCAGIPQSGLTTLYVVADPDNKVKENNENNNEETATINIQTISGTIEIATPQPNQELTIGATILVDGWANSTQTPSGHLQDITIRVRLLDSDGGEVNRKTGTTTSAGKFSMEFLIPEGISAGSYQICAETDYGDVPDECISVTLTGGEIEFPWWILILIIVIVVVLIVAAVLYIRYRGLGKMVECGECGALIPEGSSKCPKCGVEFEVETVKCSNCGAWIPSEAKSCPECGTVFVVGEVKAEDYQQKMRDQYDSMVNKFKEQAKKDLGETFTEEQFQAWWRGQPTFITFQTWLREEEEMKKLGSAACPICGTLNSVTATICHRCGTPLKRVTREEPRAGAPPAGPPAAPAAPPAPPGPPTVPVPKKVIKKPVEKVVQKKVVVRRPPGPGEEREE